MMKVIGQRCTWESLDLESFLPCHACKQVLLACLLHNRHKAKPFLCMLELHMPAILIA